MVSTGWKNFIAGVSVNGKSASRVPSIPVVAVNKPLIAITAPLSVSTVRLPDTVRVVIVADDAIPSCPVLLNNPYKTYI